VLFFCHTRLVSYCRPNPGDAAAVEIAAQNIYDSMATNDWLVQLDDLQEALYYGVGDGNPFTSEPLFQCHNADFRTCH
jgi:hypothetical protein